jgi:hypothetical protein
MKGKGLLRIVLLALLAVLVQETWALGSNTGGIEGKVTDQNGNPVGGVKVTAASPSQSATVTTASNGFYSVLNLSPDTYSITASKDGFDTSTVSGITVQADQNTAADIKMRSSVRTLGHVTTRAAASVVSKTVTGDLYAVNAQAINNYQGSQGGAETLYSQSGVVASLPGVVRIVGAGVGHLAASYLRLQPLGEDLNARVAREDAKGCRETGSLSNNTGFNSQRPINPGAVNSCRQRATPWSIV